MPTGGPQFGQPSNQKLEDEQETNFKSLWKMPSGVKAKSSLNQEEEDGNAIWWTAVQLEPGGGGWKCHLMDCSSA